ncbi:MAG TPA: ABC transporter substrate-binding protein [Streptosporangiaceae bacterium]
MRRPLRARYLPLAAASAVTALAVAACGSTSATTASSTSSAKPITVGISLPLSGSFMADGLATRNGYELWASDVNTHGGLLGRPVRLKILNDKSNDNLVVSQYTQLIRQDHVDLTLAPFSTLLTADALKPTSQYGYALPAGSATGGLVFGAGGGHTYTNLFSVSVPAANEMEPFAQWVIHQLPASEKGSAAYPEVDDPFADPPVTTTMNQLAAAGIKTVYQNTQHPANPASQKQIQAVANQVTRAHPDIVVIGSVDLPSLLIFVHTFQNANYTPRVMIAASGPDQGQAFINQLNPINAQAIMVPDGWYGQVQNALSEVMVQDYIAKFGGTSSDINADVAEAYSAGEVLADAVTATHGTNNSKIIKYLHSLQTPLQTVQGAVQFQSDGANSAQHGLIFQWQNGQFAQVLGVTTGKNAANVLTQKPPWGTS